MRPLGIAADDFALVYPAFVGPTAELCFEGATYCMPAEAACMSAEVHVFPARVLVVAGKHQALHDRKAPGERSVLPEHRASHVAAVSGVRGKRYLRRQHIMELGNDALAYVTELVYRRPGRWHADIDAIHAWLQLLGDRAVLVAIRRALHDEVFGSEYVRWYLDHPDSGGAEVDR